jgi:hypothetical protein
MNNPKVVVIVAVVALLAVGTILVFTLLPGGSKRVERRTSEVMSDASSLTEPLTSKMRNFVPMTDDVEPRTRRNDATIQVEPQREQTEQGQTKLHSLTLVGFDPAPAQVRTPPARKYPQAPTFRCLPCQLVNTVDSGNIATPIIGRVTRDLIRHGEVVIPRGTEVHGQAQVDTMRERIASRGDFTLIIHDLKRPAYDDKELVVSGIVLDREYDPEFDTYGLIDMGAGLPGQVIETGDKRLVDVFVASFLAGIAQNTGSPTNGAFGNRLYTNGNAIGTSALQNLVVNPAANGMASVLDMYAQQIMKAIQRDGFYIRVPSGTEFYLYVTQSINLGDATRGESADENRVRREEQEWRQQANRRAVNSANGFFQGLMGGGATEPEPPALLPPPKKEEPDPLEHLSSVPGSPRVDSQSAAQDFKSPFVNQVGEKP